MGDIPLEQSRDNTLGSAFRQVIEIDCHVVRPEAVQTSRLCVIKRFID